LLNGRQEVRGEEWSEGDEVRTALVLYGRWAGIATREECLAVEHRGSDRDTTRAVQAEAQKESDPSDCLQRKVHASPEAITPANPASFAILFIAANNR